MTTTSENEVQKRRGRPSGLKQTKSIEKTCANNCSPIEVEINGNKACISCKTNSVQNWSVKDA